MENHRPPLLFLPLLIAASLLHLPASVGYIDPAIIAAVEAENSPAPSPTVDKDAEFIRSSCENTLYPEMCYNSLAGYSSAVQQDAGRLARVAVGVSLVNAKRTFVYFVNLSHNTDYGAEPRASAALHDCFSVLSDAVDQIRGSLREMRQLGSSGESVRFQMSNVQTWMSAALTNEDTCTDGFEDVQEGPLKTKVTDKIVKVKEVTSNALALVNSFAGKVTGP